MSPLVCYRGISHWDPCSRRGGLAPRPLCEPLAAWGRVYDVTFLWSIGPQLFNIIINDIISCVTDPTVQITFYADDAVIYTADQSPKIIKDKLQLVATKIHTCCDLNGVKMNVNKSKICVYGTRSMLDKGVDIDILIDNLKLSRCEVYTYLGVQIDECLTLQKHFKYICRRFTQTIFKLSKLKNSIDENTRILLYKQNILPLVEYADIMLYHVRKHDLEKLQ